MTAAIRSLARIELVSRDPDALAGFYRAAFEFAATGLPSPAGHVELKLGRQTLRLIRAGRGGRAFPVDVPGWSPRFQHIAIVVGDMQQAYRHLGTVAGWTPISVSGPQILPKASGGVGAFKFRDPEGHPLELIAFAAGAIPAQWQVSSQKMCLGIDHSAISVSSTAASVAFYEGLGLHRSAHSLNVGQEQALLDDVPDAVVEVTALSPSQATPHVELLYYRGEFDRHMPAQGIDDVTATRLVLTVDNPAALATICARASGVLLSAPELCEDDRYRASLRDPDGHLIRLETAS